MKLFDLIKISILFFLSTAFDSESTKYVGYKQFLALSDIHFTPYASCQIKSTSCALIEKLRAAPAEQWDSIFQKYDSAIPGTYSAETNTVLLNSTLNEIRKLPKTYQFVILTGDLLGHHYEKYFHQFIPTSSAQDYQQFVDKTNIYLKLKLKKTFPATPVYFAPGNNDTYDGDYHVSPSTGFYKKTAQIWKDMIPNPENKAAFEKSYSKAGYYAITLKHDNKEKNRVIFLNSILFSIFAVGSDISTEAQQELSWLKNQLQDAKNHQEHVWLVYHIPNGINAYATVQLKIHMHTDAPVPFWQSQYNEALLNLIQQYSDTITTLISAHQHMDAFQLIYPENLLNTSIPAISPQFGNNPAFKLYEYNPESMQLTNFKTYYLNEKTGLWSLEYDFNSVYKKIKSAYSLSNTYAIIRQEGWRADLYKKYFAADTNSQPITQGYWFPYYWCSIIQQTEEGYQHCIG